MTLTLVAVAEPNKQFRKETGEKLLSMKRKEASGSIVPNNQGVLLMITLHFTEESEQKCTGQKVCTERKEEKEIAQTFLDSQTLSSSETFLA